MKKAIILYVLVFLLLCLSACNKPTYSDAVTEKNGIIDINILEAANDVRDFKLSEIVKDVEIVELESNVESFFRSPRSIKITQNFILLNCQSIPKVFLFRRSGEFVGIIGRNGKGPGEYYRPWYATIDPGEENIIILDYQSKKIIRYSINGELILEKSIADECPQWPEFQPMFLDDTHFAFPVRRPDAPTDDFYSIYIYDLELNLINKLIPRANNDELCLRRLFQMTLEDGAEGPFYWERFTDTLYYFDLESDAKAAYHFTITENKISKEFLSDPMTYKPGEKFYHLIGITDLSKHLIIRTNLDNRCLILYDKKKKEAFRVNDFWQCDTTIRESKFAGSLENDVFGFEPVRIYHHQKEEHLFPFLLHLDYTGSTKDLECILQKKVTHPEVRDQLMEMVKNCTGEELPVLVLMHLK